jgi:hypothetical protein
MSEPRDVIVAPDACQNCGTSLTGEYCHHCGQRRIADDELSVSRFVHELRDEVVHLDFKTLRSLRALARPGFLTAEYLEGRRRAYTSPLRLYFLCAALFFLGARFAGFDLQSLIEQDRTGTIRRMADARMAALGMHESLFTERYDLRLQTVYTFALSISVAASAFTLKALFRNKAWPLGAHVVFAVHYVSFLYLMALLFGGITQRVESPPVQLALVYTVVAPYLFVALKRVYGDSTRATLLKMAVLLAATAVIDNVVNVGAILLTFALV